MQWWVCSLNPMVTSHLTLINSAIWYWLFAINFDWQDKKGNPPGIIRDAEVDPLPPLFVSIIKRLVGWHVLPPTAVPNSCIVNIYEEGDCIPPHIDHHDFVRPFCTVSFLTECNILFGSNLKIIGPGEFSGPVAIPLPVGYVSRFVPLSSPFVGILSWFTTWKLKYMNPFRRIYLYTNFDHNIQNVHLEPAFYGQWLLWWSLF